MNEDESIKRTCSLEEVSAHLVSQGAGATARAFRLFSTEYETELSKMTPDNFPFVVIQSDCGHTFFDLLIIDAMVSGYNISRDVDTGVITIVDPKNSLELVDILGTQKIITKDCYEHIIPTKMYLNHTHPEYRQYHKLLHEAKSLIIDWHLAGGDSITATDLKALVQKYSSFIIKGKLFKTVPALGDVVREFLKFESRKLSSQPENLVATG